MFYSHSARPSMSYERRQVASREVTFKGYRGLQAILRADPGAFTECLAGKMLIYALGRGLARNDRKTVKGIAERVARDGYRFSSLVLEIARSAPFQMKKESRGAR